MRKVVLSLFVKVEDQKTKINTELFKEQILIFKKHKTYSFENHAKLNKNYAQQQKSIST